MIPVKEIEKLPVLPAAAKGNQKSVGCARIYKGVLVLDLYDARYLMAPEGEEKEASIAYRYVCDKKNYYTYDFMAHGWSMIGLRSLFCGCYSGRTIDRDYALDGGSRETIERFLADRPAGKWDCGPRGRLINLEDDIRETKRERKEARRQERIRKRTEQIKPFPKDWARWLDNHVFQEERYIFYKDGVGRCAHCGKTAAVPKGRLHNTKGKCPACGSRITYKASGIKNRMDDRKQTVYLQKTPDGFLIRYIIVGKISWADGERYEYVDVVLATWDGQKMHYDYHARSGFSGKTFWTDSRPADMSRWEGNGYLYTRNVRQALKDTKFRYAPLVLWKKKTGWGSSIGDFLEKYETSPFLEFFVKAGLIRLTGEYIRSCYEWKGEKPEEILRIDRQRIRRLIATNGGIIALKWLQYEQEHGARIPDETIRWLEGGHVHADRCTDALKTVGSVTRMVNYIKKQDMEPSDTVTMWSDYLRMAENGGCDMTDDIVRFPKDLRLRHGQIVAFRERERDRERLKGYAPLDARIRARLPQVRRYFWENKDYMIIPAGCCKELMDEGRNLHHCVGRDDHYMKKMADGVAWILFLRKKEEPETPWYTVEIDMENDNIIQFYSAFDRQPEKKKVKKLLDTFRKAAGRKRIQVGITA